MVNLGISLDDLKKEKIFPVLMNQAESEQLEESAPLRPFLDLMIGFRIILVTEAEKPGEEIRTAILNYGTMYALGITEEELWRDYKNSFPEALTPGYISLSSVLGSGLGIPMFVISNSATLY